MPFVATQMELEGIILSAMSQKKKEILNGVIYMWNLEQPNTGSDKDKLQHQPVKTDHRSETFRRVRGRKEAKQSEKQGK